MLLANLVCIFEYMLLSDMLPTAIRWMNGQYLKALPSDKLIKCFGDRWKSSGTLLESEGTFVQVQQLFQMREHGLIFCCAYTGSLYDPT